MQEDLEAWPRQRALFLLILICKNDHTIYVCLSASYLDFFNDALKPPGVHERSFRESQTLLGSRGSRGGYRHEKLRNKTTLFSGTIPGQRLSLKAMAHGFTGR